MNRDHDHLKLLGVFHYVNAALMGCTTSFGAIYLGFMAAMVLPMIQTQITADAERARAAAKQAEAVANEEESAAQTDERQEEDEPTKDDEQQETDDSTASDPTASPAAIPPVTPPVAPPFNNGPPEEFISMMTGMIYTMGALMLAFGFLTAFANVYAARCIARRKHRTFCLLTAGFNCLHAPIGLVLGVFSFIVLLRPSVEDLFAGHPPNDATIIEADIVD